MSDYKFNKREIVTNFSTENIESMYQNGFLFGRIQKGQMDQTKSLRIDLNKFSFNSENRRILKKTENFKLEIADIPLDIEKYDFKIHMIGKKFYEAKNNKTVFSASKIKELVTDELKSNFNKILTYSVNNDVFGYTIAFESQNIFHYAYPFYDLQKELSNLGMGMILKAIEYSMQNGKQYFYLGSVNTQKSLYKLQFNNMEWWDGVIWSTDFEKLKTEVRSTNS